ncbi:MAG: Sua5/YciO/YrdC/YwlC family protein, partial [Krumholzibacteria bacterium]|nr:Sua5/YciO/YrdC/YwlC family protein [Candidatus Krumholzibacteria bacterium]
LVPCPLVSTSANRSGEEPAVTLAEAVARLGDDVDGVFDPADEAGGAGAASALVDLTVWPPRVLREGPLAAPPVLDPSGGET